MDTSTAQASSSRRSFSLRAATPVDAEQVAGLIARVWTKHFGWSVPPNDLEVHLKTTLSVDTIRRTITNPDHRFIVAQNDVPSDQAGVPLTNGHSESLGDPDLPTQIIGVAQLVFGPTEPCLTLPNPAELNRLYVDDALQGSGLASALVKEAEIVAKGAMKGSLNSAEDQVEESRTDHSEPLCSLWLGVWENNPRAIRFYEKMGFKTVGEHTFLVGENVRRDWVMEKAVT